MHNFDASALDGPIDRARLRQFKESRSRRFPRSHSGSGGSQTATGIVMLVAGTIMTMIGGGLLFADRFSGVIVGTILVVFGSIVGASGAVIIFSNGLVKTQYRLDQFARANGMSFNPGFRDPQLPGMLFHVGRSRASHLLVRGDKPRFVEFGNYQYTTGSGKHSQTHHWGYIAVRLDTPLPNIVLDAEGNNGLFGSNLPVNLNKDQRLDLEGNFNEYFSLYAPAGYETDALYLFTPDIMQRFMNNAAQLDVEIVDDWLFFYTRENASTLDADRWAWLFSVVGAMLEKINRWGRWRDERLQVAPAARAVAAGPENPALQNPQQLQPPRGVATPGRRLKKKSFAWVTVVAVVVMVAIQIIPRLF